MEQRERLYGLTLGQVDSFLTLVEVGSPVLAARRLGLSRSTLSAHIKTLGADLNQRLFDRVPKGLGLTHAGIEAHDHLRPLMMRAGYCLAHFHSEALAPPVHINIVLPSGFPGALMDRAIARTGRAIADRQPATWMSPIYGLARQRDPGTWAFDFRAGPTGAALRKPNARIRDRWVVVRASARTGWSARALDLSALAGAEIAIPRLPQAQVAALHALAETAGARTDVTDHAVDVVLAGLSHDPHRLCMIPAALLNTGLVHHVECSLLDESEWDPVIVVTGSFDPDVVSEIGRTFSNLLGARQPGELSIDPAPARLSLKHCRSFLALCEEKSVRRAAQRLCIVQPAMSVQLQGLEDLLKTSLFVRSHHGLQPNAQADKLYALLAPLTAQFGMAVRNLREPEGRSRRLSLGMIPSVDAESEVAECFSDALDRWSSAHPDIVVQVLEAFSSKLLRWLSSGRVDFALIDRIAENPDMVFDLIAEDGMAVVADRAASMLPPGPIPLADIGTLPLVLPSGRHGLRSILARHLRKLGLDLQPRIEVDSMGAAISLVKRGRYATILPVGAIYKSRDRRRLSIHEICEPRIIRSICLARMRTNLPDAAIQAFIAELRLAFSKPGDFRDAVSGATESLARAIPQSSGWSSHD